MKVAQPAVPNEAKSTSPIPPVLAPKLMMVFWMLLGGAAGIKIMESICRVCGVEVGELTIALSVGGAMGALGGALLDYRLSIGGILLSIATLTLDIVIALLGLQTVTFGGSP